jgi:hypothetical protein
LTKFRAIIAFTAVVVMASVLAGCRAEEQGRPLVLKKGDYSGPRDAPLSEKQVNELKDRAALQGDSTVGSAGSVVIERPEQEKPAPVSKELNERLRLQVGPPSVASPGQSDTRPQTNAAPAPAAPPAAPPATAPATPERPAPATQTPSNPANN